MKAKGIAAVVIAAAVLAACGGEKANPKEEKKIYFTDEERKNIIDESNKIALDICTGNILRIIGKKEKYPRGTKGSCYFPEANISKMSEGIIIYEGNDVEIEGKKYKNAISYTCDWDFNRKSVNSVTLITKDGEYKKDLIPIDESCKKTPSCLAEKLVPALNNQCKKAIEESYSDLYGEKMVFPDSVEKIHYTNTNWDTLDTERKGIDISGGSLTIKNAEGNEEKVEYGCTIDSVYQTVMSGWALVRDKDTVTDIVMCKEDPACMAKKYQPVFDADCRTLIESLAEKSARYEYKIEYGLLTSPYSRVKFTDKKKSILELYGNKIKFQNGFGAWQKVGYTCRFDIDKKKVTGVRFIQ
ncbi:MAG: hypothetical protein NC112_05730 [Oxalobacter formigenes]|nr:hypothetical protein [Oxalobacter formigenes]